MYKSIEGIRGMKSKITSTLLGFFIIFIIILISYGVFILFNMLPKNTVPFMVLAIGIVFLIYLFFRAAYEIGNLIKEFFGYDTDEIGKVFDEIENKYKS